MIEDKNTTSIIKTFQDHISELNNRYNSVKSRVKYLAGGDWALANPKLYITEFLESRNDTEDSIPLILEDNNLSEAVLLSNEIKDIENSLKQISEMIGLNYHSIDHTFEVLTKFRYSHNMSIKFCLGYFIGSAVTFTIIVVISSIVLGATLS